MHQLRTARCLCEFDSSAAAVRAVGRFLRGKDFPALGVARLGPAGRRGLPPARRLSESAGEDGTYVEVDGAHTFPWLDPGSWAPPIRRPAQRLTDHGPS